MLLKKLAEEPRGFDWSNIELITPTFYAQTLAQMNKVNSSLGIGTDEFTLAVLKSYEMGLREHSTAHQLELKVAYLVKEKIAEAKVRLSEISDEVSNVPLARKRELLKEALILKDACENMLNTLEGNSD